LPKGIPGLPKSMGPEVQLKQPGSVTVLLVLVIPKVDT